MYNINPFRYFTLIAGMYLLGQGANSITTRIIHHMLSRYLKLKTMCTRTML